MRRKRAAETPAQKRERQRKMRDAARDKSRRRDRHRPAKRSAEIDDALRAGMSILGEREMHRPTFVVITPQGRRIETLEPDKI